MKRTLLFLLLALMSFSAMDAVPAYRGAVNVRQPDGSVITFFMRGDENNHVCVSIDGLRLLQDEGGVYRYANLTENNKLTTAGSPIAHNPNERTAKEVTFIANLKDVDAIKKAPVANAIKSIKAAKGAASRFQIGNYPTVGKGRCLVLLVEFTDRQFSLGKDYHERLLNEEGFSENGTTGCARDYYLSQSNGQFDPHFDLIGPIMMSHSTSYYGSDGIMGQTDEYVGKMIKEACQKAHDDFNVDFSQYDGDDDGSVDMIYVIYAGYGQHAGGGANTIWPHKYQLSGFGIELSLNGKSIDVYACSSELFGNSGTQSSGIGTICHEFGHVLGLADHYNTADATDYKLGSYDIMDYGSYNNDGKTPPYYNAFERMTLGWLTPEELTTPTDGVVLNNIGDSNQAYLIATSNPDEFYLLENRQKTGWDRYIPSDGMMITHVDYDENAWNYNTVNNNTAHPRFCIIPADNSLAYDIIAEKETEKYDLYPITSNNSFTDNSVPAAKPWNGETLDKWVTDIAKDNGIVSFNFMPNHLLAPSNLSASDITENSFTASWEAVEKASEYTLSLYTLGFRSAEKYALCEGFSLMGHGSISAPSATDISNSLDSYTAEKGWSGNYVYQAGGWCQIGNTSAGGSIVTPELNMKRFDGEYAVAVTVKSPAGESPVFSVSANGLTGKTRINSVQRTYLFRFNGGISKNRVTFATNSGRAYIDSITIVRGDAAGMFTGSKEVAVSGTPQTVEGDVEDRDFIHTDTLIVKNIKELEYTFRELKPQSYYSFAVKATGEGSESYFSNEHIVFTGNATGITQPGFDANLTTSKRKIYTIDGRMTRSMETPGIYIIINGNNVSKIIKK